jgi:hypothetical protein
MENSRFYALAASLFAVAFVGVFLFSKGLPAFASWKSEAKAKQVEIDKKQAEANRERDALRQAMAALKEQPCDPQKMRNLSAAITNFTQSSMAKAGCNSSSNCDPAVMAAITRETAGVFMGAGAMTAYMQGIRASLPDDENMPRRTSSNGCASDFPANWKGVTHVPPKSR